MRILQVAFETGDCSYDIVLPEGDSLSSVVSNSEQVRMAFIAAIELAVFKASDDQYAGLVRKSKIVLDTGALYEFPYGRFDLEATLPFAQEVFLNIIVGRYPVDIVACVRGGEYHRHINAYLSRLSGGALKSIRWDSAIGLSIELQNGKSPSVFHMSTGQLEIIKFAGRLADLKMKRYPCQIFTPDPIRLLGADNEARLYLELFDVLRTGVQIVFVSTLMDVIGSPLSMLEDMRVFDLDDKEGPCHG